MGLLKLLRNINNAEGARESIRLSYNRHFRLAKNRGQPPHPTALFCALGARWKAAGRAFSEPRLWAEIAPFLCMPPEVGRDALGEYVVCLERPQEGRIGWLRKQINENLERPYDSEEAQTAQDVAASGLLAYEEDLGWAGMLRDNVRASLTARAYQVHMRNSEAADPDQTVRELERLATLMKVPREVFVLDKPLEEVLESLSKADLFFLYAFIGDCLKRAEMVNLHGALQMLRLRLQPLLPAPGEIDRESFAQAYERLYEQELP